MVQTYGIAAENNVDSSPTDVRHADESRALLGGGTAAAGTTAKKNERPDGHATMASCISNLANTIMGTGRYPYRWSYR